METGIVKWCNDAKRFGFITSVSAATICSHTFRKFELKASSR
jgi:cold shock CspA family protein